MKGLSKLKKDKETLTDIIMFLLLALSITVLIVIL